MCSHQEKSSGVKYMIVATRVHLCDKSIFLNNIHQATHWFVWFKGVDHYPVECEIYFYLISASHLFNLPNNAIVTYKKVYNKILSKKDSSTILSQTLSVKTYFWKVLGMIRLYNTNFKYTKNFLVYLKYTSIPDYFLF